MVPNGWEVKKLGELCSLNPKKPSKPDDGVVSFIAMPQLSESGKVISTKKKPYDEVSKGFTSFVNKDVLVAKITPCFENGKGALVDNLENGIGFGSTEFHVLRAKKGTHPEFIYYLTRTKELRVKGEMNMQGSAGHRRVTADYFNAYKVVTPPYSEQRKIAQILSTWDRGIATTEKLIETSKQQKKALMQQLLTGKKRLVNPETGKAFEEEWAGVKLGDICSKVTDGAHHSPKSVECGYPMFSVKDMRATNFSENTARHISEEDYQALVKQNCKPELNDILIAKDGSILKYCFVVKEEIEGVILSSIALLRPKLNVISPNFIAQYFSQESVRFFVGKALTSGSGVPRIILKDFKGIHLRVPSLLEQQKIASVLTASDKEIEVLESKLAHFKQEKKALMQQLLTGKCRVKVDEMEVA